MRISKSGFTIVELLVVIVVIGILAAISIVSYNGISARAMDTKIKSLTASVGEILQIESLDGVTPGSSGYWGNTNGVDSIVSPKYLPTGYRDDLVSSSANYNSRIFRYYRCGDGFVIYVSISRPTANDIQSVQNAKTQCGHTDTHAPVTPPLVYNYAQIF